MRSNIIFGFFCARITEEIKILRSLILILASAKLPKYRNPSKKELRLIYSHRSPIETNFFVAQDIVGMEMPRARS